MSDKKTLVIGYRFLDAGVQIAYYTSDMEEPQLLVQDAQTHTTQIPACLCKLTKSSQWLFGEEAHQAYEQGMGEYVEDLLAICEGKEPVVVEDVPYTPAELLTIYVKKSFNLLHRICNLDQIQALTFTFPKLTKVLVEDMRQVMQQLPVPQSRLFLQDFKESYYEFVTNQKRELWSNEALLLDARGGKLHAWSLVRLPGSHSQPFVVQETDFPDFSFGNKDRTTDLAFARRMDQWMQKRLISSVFLVGKEFEGDWMQESLHLLCRGRRVFGVTDLMVKGACYRGLRKQEREDKRQFYLGDYKLTSHIGLYVWNGREQQYCRMVWAGTSWFEADTSHVFLVDNCNSIQFQMDEVTEEKTSLRKSISLDFLPKRPNLATKIRLDLQFTDAKNWTVTVTDLGLGELFAASHKSITEEMGG